MWRWPLIKIGDVFRALSNCSYWLAGDESYVKQQVNQLELRRLEKLLEPHEQSKDDLILEEGDPAAENAGVSLGLTQPVYYVVASPNKYKQMAMHILKDAVVRDTISNLEAKSNGEWTDHDDDLFGPHTLLVTQCIKHNTPLLAIDAWKQSIRNAVATCEAELGKPGPPARIHKGAILHNVAVCHLIAGDLDSAFQLFSAAGNEDHLSGRGDWANVVLGQHGLTEGRLITPVIDFADANSDWSETFAKMLSTQLDAGSLKALLTWLAAKEEDAIQFLHALHRFVMSGENFPSRVQPHIQVRAIADVILVIESSLRRWQTGVTGQLYDRMSASLPSGSAAKQAFDDAHSAYCNQFPGQHPDKETDVGINWAISDCIRRFHSEASTAKRAGITAYLAVRLRNSLMHVILGDVSLYTNDTERQQVMGLMLSCVALSKAANEGSFPTA